MTICLNTYTPNRYLGHASFEAQITHDYILSFKSGRSAAQKRAAREVCLALSMTNMENVVFACIPASCNRTNTLRYRNFSQMVCERTGATNAYGHIIINGKRSKLHRSKAHLVCDAANEEIHLDPDMSPAFRRYCQQRQEHEGVRQDGGRDGSQGYRRYRTRTYETL